MDDIDHPAVVDRPSVDPPLLDTGLFYMVAAAN
jgi:hypothetical protein